MLDYSTTIGTPAKPTSGQTITIFDSSDSTKWDRYLTPLTELGARLVFKLYSDHDSGASGVVIESSSIASPAASDWVAVAGFPVTYTSANGSQIYDIVIADRNIRIKYTNSASALTYWDVSLSITPDRSAAA